MYTLVRDLVHSLDRNMVLRANGTMHNYNCLNATVNSIWYPCSISCIEDNKRLRVAQLWLARCENIPQVPKLKVPVSNK